MTEAETDSSAEYLLKTDSEKNLSSIEARDGKPVQIDPTDVAYATFLNWASSALSLFQMRAKPRRFTLKPLRDNALDRIPRFSRLARIFHQIF
jgi:hypothetical protein